jgi:hypothetical protein
MQLTTLWTDQLDANTRAFEAAFGHLSSQTLNVKPTPDTWSIAQNLDHLIVINESYFPAFEALREGSYRAGWLAKVTPWVWLCGTIVLRASRPDRQNRMRTFNMWEPTESEISGDIIQRFVAHQETLKDWIRDLESALDRKAVIVSPASKRIVYRLKTAFDIITLHEQRHLAQAEEALAQVEGRGQ